MRKAQGRESAFVDPLLLCCDRFAVGLVYFCERLRVTSSNHSSRVAVVNLSSVKNQYLMFEIHVELSCNVGLQRHQLQMLRLLMERLGWVGLGSVEPLNVRN